MTRWDDLPWNERILQLDLNVEEKSAAINLIDSLGEPWPARQEAAVPKDKAVALDSIRNRLKASGVPCNLHAFLLWEPCFTLLINLSHSMYLMCKISNTAGTDRGSANAGPTGEG